MPSTRRAAAAGKAAAAAGPKRRSKLAREHGLSADQEAEIREAFSLFAVQHPDHNDSEEGVIRAQDVRRCLKSLNLTPASSELPEILSTIDPLRTGYVPFVPFLSYAAIAIQTKGEEEAEDDDADDEFEEDTKEENEEQARVATAREAKALREVYTLFTHGTAGPITLAHLRRVAKELREEVDDNMLKTMITQANGAVPGPHGDVGGVNFNEFAAIMKRSGIPLR